MKAIRALVCALMLLMFTGVCSASIAEPLTVMVFDRGNMTEEYGTVTENFWTGYVQQTALRELGLKVEFVGVSRSNDENQLTFMLENGTAPDIVFTYNQDLWLNACASGMAADLTDLVQEVGGNILEQHAAVLRHGQYDGKQMGLTNLRAVTDASCAFIRKDWLDLLGITLRETEEGVLGATPEELLHILTQFQQADFAGKGPDAPVFRSYGTTYWPILKMIEAHYNQANITREDCFALPFFLFDGAKEGYRYVNTLYNKGLMNRDFAFLGDADKTQYADTIAAGEVGLWINDPWFGIGADSVLANLFRNNPAAQVAALDILTPDGKPSFKYNYNDTGMYIFVPSYSRHAREAVAYLNLLARPEIDFVLRFGFEHEHYEMVDGLPTAIDEAYNDRTRIDVPDLALMYNGCAYLSDNLNARLSMQMNPVSQQPLRRSAYLAATCNAFQVPAIAEYIPEISSYAALLDSKERELRLMSIMCAPEDFDRTWRQCVDSYLAAGGQKVINLKREAYRQGQP